MITAPTSKNIQNHCTTAILFHQPIITYSEVFYFQYGLLSCEQNSLLDDN